MKKMKNDPDMLEEYDARRSLAAIIKRRMRPEHRATRSSANEHR